MQSPCNDGVTLRRLNNPFSLTRWQAPAMKDLLRSPLQFVRPMTDHEWQDLVLRASHRERQRVQRHQPKPRLLDVTGRRRRHEHALKQTDSSASL
jgi:hypothetical protein